MSWVLVRRYRSSYVPIPAYRVYIWQMYRNADLYGRNGKWKDNYESKVYDLPHQFRFHDDAEKQLKDKQKTDPDWDYSIEYYE